MYTRLVVGNTCNTWLHGLAWYKSCSDFILCFMMLPLFWATNLLSQLSPEASHFPDCSTAMHLTRSVWPLYSWIIWKTDKYEVPNYKVAQIKLIVGNYPYSSKDTNVHSNRHQSTIIGSINHIYKSVWMPVIDEELHTKLGGQQNTMNTLS